jgi:hypothetical protein
MGSSDFKHPADGTHIFDDFLGNSAVADATLGEVGWELTTVGNASTLAFVAAQNGVLRFTTASTADGDGQVINTHPDGIVLSGSNQWLRGRFRYPNITGNQLAGNNFRFGFSASVTATEPAVGVWVDSDAGVLSFDVASTNGDISAAAAGVSTLTSGTTMVLGTWHDVEIQMDGTNANGGPDRIRLFVDGELAAEIKNVLLGSAETMEFSLIHWQDTGSADDLELDVDFVEAWLPRN